MVAGAVASLLLECTQWAEVVAPNTEAASSCSTPEWCSAAYFSSQLDDALLSSTTLALHPLEMPVEVLEQMAEATADWLAAWQWETAGVRDALLWAELHHPNYLSWPSSLALLQVCVIPVPLPHTHSTVGLSQYSCDCAVSLCEADLQPSL